MTADAKATESPAPEPAAAGVSLARYAAVHAALAEEIPLETALRHEGLDPDTWPTIEAAWAARMSESAAGDQRLFDAYDAHLARARARFARPLPPVDEDLRAYLDLIRAWSEADDPFALQEEIGLRSPDLSRLQALWSDRLAADAALRSAALAILDEPPGPCPKVSPSPVVLPPPIEPVLPAPAAPTVPHNAPPTRPSLLVPLPTTAPASAPPTGTPRDDFGAAAPAGASMAIVPPNVVLSPAVTRPSDAVSPWGSDVRGTFTGVIHRGEAFPFNPNAPSSLPSSTGTERLARVASDVGATIDAPAAPAGPALPFPAAADFTGPGGFSLQQYVALCVELTAAPGDVEVKEVLRRYEITAEQRKALDEHWQGRIASDLRVLGAFERAHKEAAARFAAQRGQSPPRAAPPVTRPPAELSGTSVGSFASLGRALPFTPDAAGSSTISTSAPSASPPANTAPPVKRAPPELSGTSMAVAQPDGPALPFIPDPASPPPATASPANMPPVKRAPAALSGTSVRAIARKEPALPFKPDGAVTPGASASNSAAAAPTNMPPVKRAPAALSGTFIGKIAQKGAVLPFGANAPSSRPDSAAEPPPAPTPSTEPPPGGLSLQHYASLCVELAVVPSEVDTILHRYRITAEQRAALDAYWRGRIGADPRVRTVFDQAYAAYEAWFVASRGR